MNHNLGFPDYIIILATTLPLSINIYIYKVYESKTASAKTAKAEHTVLKRPIVRGSVRIYILVLFYDSS